MLVLQRKAGEAIILNGVIRIIIGSVSADGRVKLLIEAPPDVIVLREELLGISSDPVSVPAGIEGENSG